MDQDDSKGQRDLWRAWMFARPRMGIPRVSTPMALVVLQLSMLTVVSLGNTLAVPQCTKTSPTFDYKFSGLVGQQNVTEIFSRNFTFTLPSKFYTCDRVPFSSISPGQYDGIEIFNTPFQGYAQTFAMAGGLVVLRMRNVSKVVLSEGFLSQMPKLAVLEIRSSGITKLPADLGTLYNLEILDLYDNPMRSLSGDIFRKLTKLLFVNLGKTQIKLLPLHAFDHLPRLRYVAIASSTRLQPGLNLCALRNVLYSFAEFGNTARLSTLTVRDPSQTTGSADVPISKAICNQGCYILPDAAIWCLSNQACQKQAFGFVCETTPQVYLCPGTKLKLVAPPTFPTLAHGQAKGQCAKLGGQIISKQSIPCLQSSNLQASGPYLLRDLVADAAAPANLLAETTDNQQHALTAVLPYLCVVQYEYQCHTGTTFVTPPPERTRYDYALAGLVCDSLGAHLPDRNEADCANSFLLSNGDWGTAWLRDMATQDTAFTTAPLSASLAQPVNTQHRIICEKSVASDYCPWVYPKDSTVTYSAGRTLNSALKLKCDIGYASEHGADSTCTRYTANSGKWSPSLFCKAILNYCPRVTAHFGVLTLPPQLTLGSLASLRCNPGYRDVHGTVLACVANAVAFGKWNITAQCDRYHGYCPVLVVVHGSATYHFNLALGDVATASCNYGYQFLSSAPDYNQATCQAHNHTSGAWSNVPICQVITSYCTNLQFSNGRMTAQHGGKVGHSEVLHCDVGYTSNAAPTYTCQAATESTGRWYGTAECRKSTDYCPIWTITNGQIVYYDNRKLGTTAKITCDEGYIPLAGVYFICLLDVVSQGRWNATAKCIVDNNYCTRHGAIPNGHVTYATTLHRGSVATLVCDYGYDAADAYRLQCITKVSRAGEWSPAAGCIKLSNYCPRLQVSNGLLTNTDARKLGAQVTLWCDIGYTPKYGTNFACVAHNGTVGKWNATAWCQLLSEYCPALNISNGNITYHGNRTLGDKLTLTCDEGLVPLNGTSFTCLRDNNTAGKWEETMACVLDNNYCSDISNVSHGYLMYTGGNTPTLGITALNATLNTTLNATPRSSMLPSATPQSPTPSSSTPPSSTSTSSTS
eukprot:scpid30834/ scgid24882/ Complement receptor type 2; Complement C3d receptor